MDNDYIDVDYMVEATEKHLTKAGIPFHRSQVLEYVASISGDRNWNVTQAKMKVQRGNRNFMIVSESEEGFWSNRSGWGDIKSATQFSDQQRSQLNLPNSKNDDAAWVEARNADSYLSVSGKYLRHKGCSCPICGGDNISGNEWNADAGYSTQEVSCDDCNAQWLDSYTLTGMELLDNGDRDEDNKSDAEIFEIEMRNGSTGTSEFFKYSSRQEMNEGLKRLTDKSKLLYDGCTRYFWEVNGYDQGDISIRGDLLDQISGQMPGSAKQDTVNEPPKLSLHDRRRNQAEKAFQDWHFPENVESCDGWEIQTHGDFSEWSRAVYIEDSEDPSKDTFVVRFIVSFSNDNMTIDCLDSKGNDYGNLMPL